MLRHIPNLLDVNRYDNYLINMGIRDTQKHSLLHNLGTFVFCCSVFQNSVIRDLTWFDHKPKIDL